MRRLLLITFAALATTFATAKPRLSPLFSDNMVFQRECLAPVWGKAEPGAKVTVTPSWDGKTYTATADAEGRWRVDIQTPKGSFKEYEITISDGEPVTLRNVVVGEVWLASGQSNMEMWFGRIAGRTGDYSEIDKASEYPYIRLLSVSRATGMVERDYFAADFGGWTESSPKTVFDFSAAGWYFGRELQEELNVPVGIIDSSWGGTFIEAWMSEWAVKDFPEIRSQLELVKLLPDNEAEREDAFDKVIDSFYIPVWERDPGVKDVQWKDINLPAKVQDLWPGTNGIFWFRKEVDIPAGWEGHDLILSLGPVDDFDDTYWNGELIGSGRVWNKPREYSIPASMVKAGKAEILIRDTDDHGNGGLYGDADLLFIKGPDCGKIRIDGGWKVCMSMSFKGLPQLARHEPNLATVLFKAMIKPLVPFAIKGAIWYQGESNVDRPYRYRDYMNAMILDWRGQWGYDFPFLITQLAGYKAVTRFPGNDDWAELRESQAFSTKTLDKVGLACIIDIGEADDIHPVRKQEVGERLARLTLANDYGKDVVANGPRFAGYSRKGHSIRVRFTDTAGGLKVITSGDYAPVRYGKAGMDFKLVQKAESGVMTGFQIAGADRVWRWADAVIEGDEVIVSSPEVPHPVAVRYGWGVNPVCNLFNSEGLPAWPFRTDDWEGVRNRVFKVRSTSSLLRAIRKSGEGDTIILRKGLYPLKETLRIEGKKGLVIKGDGACLSGGVQIPLRRLRGVQKEEGDFAEGVRRLDLRRYPIGPVVPKGDPHLTGPSWSEFFADGVPMRLSEWPDADPLPLDSVVTPGRGYIRPKEGDGFGVIAFKEDRPLEWRNPGLGWLWGCFRFGWTSELTPIKRLGPDKTIEAGSLTNYGFGRGAGESFQRWKILNIPEEVTLPGEYSLDAAGKKCWLMLPDGTKRLEMSVMTDPLLRLEGCESVVISGIEFTCSRGDAIAIRGCSNTRIENCDIHGMGHVAATIDAASRSCGLSRCDLYDLGAGGVELAGGDRKNIVRGDNYVEYCRIHDFNRIEMQYRVGVVMSGLGNRITGCEFYNSATMAILMLGNDQTVEYCNVHHVCLDIEDNGALYHGRNPAQRGSVIRGNYFHDIEVPFNVRALYHDDGSGAVEVYGNIFRNITSPPVQMGGGSDIKYHDNIFLDLPCAAVKTDGRLKTWGADRLIAHRDSVALVDGPAFRAHYPEFASYYEGDPAEPQRNEFKRNVLYNVKWAFEKVVWSDHIYNDDITGSANFISEMSDNWKTDQNPGFKDTANPLAGFTERPALLDVIPGFVLPDLSRIPPTSDVHSGTSTASGFSGKVDGVADELHTPAGSR